MSIEDADLVKYQAKSITPVDKYVCTLSEATQKMAFEQLGETEELRQSSIKIIRDWVLNNPRIEKARLDSKIILRYLRHHRYDINCTKESFERNLIFREGLYGLDWYTNLDFNRPHVQELLDAGLVVILPDPLPETGERVICTKFSAVNTKIPNVANVGLSLATMIMETLLEDEEIQVRGFRYVFDVSGVSLGHYFLLSFSTWFKVLKNCERTYGGRHRGGYILNLPRPLAFALKLLFNNMQKKMRDGIKLCSSIQDLGIDINQLPDTFGGNASSKDITDSWKKKLTDMRPFFLNYSNMKINKEYYAPAVLNCEVKTLSHRLENLNGKLLN